MAEEIKTSPIRIRLSPHRYPCGVKRNDSGVFRRRNSWRLLLLYHTKIVRWFSLTQYAGCDPYSLMSYLIARLTDRLKYISKTGFDDIKIECTVQFLLPPLVIPSRGTREMQNKIQPQIYIAGIITKYMTKVLPVRFARNISQRA